MQRFTDKVALITGAGSGIGRATAKRLASEGARLVLDDRNQQGLEQTLSELPEGAEALTRTLAGQALAVDGGNTASLNLPGMKV